MTIALGKLRTQLGDVENLIQRHPNRQGDLVEGLRRPPGDQKPLLRSCVLLTYAAWEVYAEDSAIATVDELVTHGSLKQLPGELRAFTAQASEDPWDLAGEGWRKATLDAVTNKVRGDDSSTSRGSWGINTAGPGQLAALHGGIFGVRFMDRCSWGNRTSAWVKSQLSELVQVRGSIAHTGTTESALHLGGVEHWRDFVTSLAETLDNQLESYIASTLAAPV